VDHAACRLTRGKNSTENGVRFTSSGEGAQTDGARLTRGRGRIGEPVRFHNIQVSVVPKSSLPCAASSCAPSTFFMAHINRGVQCIGENLKMLPIKCLQCATRRSSAATMTQ
jgi:hypothetical protein